MSVVMVILLVSSEYCPRGQAFLGAIPLSQSLWMIIRAKLCRSFFVINCGHRNRSRLIRYLDGSREAIFRMKPKSLSRVRLVRKREIRASKEAALK
jgi:hypothetical protein